MRAAVAVATALISIPALGSEEPGRARVVVQWSAPVECQGLPEVMARIAELLGRPPTTPAADPLTVHAEVSQVDNASWHLELTTSSQTGQGKRSLNASTCQRIIEATALIVALAIDPAAVARARQKRESTEPQHHQSEIQCVARPFVAFDIGSLPRLATVLGATAGLEMKPFRVDFIVQSWLGQYAAATSGGFGADVAIPWSLGARGCWSAAALDVSAGVCLGGEAGPMRGVPVGLSNPTPGEGLYWGVFATGTGAWRLSSFFAITSDVSVFIPVSRPRFEIGSYGEIFRPAPVSLQASVGPELRFP